MNNNLLEVLHRLSDTFLTLSNDSAVDANRLLVEQNYATEASARIEVAKAYKRAWEIVLNVIDLNMPDRQREETSQEEPKP